MNGRVAVICGGNSREREISMVSGRAVLAALERMGRECRLIEAEPDLPFRLAGFAPAVVYNALHGEGGEDGTVQGLLEVMGIPYTHSGVLASAIAINKPVAKTLFRAAGLDTPDWRVISPGQFRAQGSPFPRPFVLKPVGSGSSVGVRPVFAGDPPDHEIAAECREKVLLFEPYIPGREIHVAVLNDRALGAVEIRPRGRFYDYAAKYHDQETVRLFPAPMSPGDYEQVLDLALKAHRMLDCRGLTRSDFRFCPDAPEGRRFCLLEINTQPGMTPGSLAPGIAAMDGIDFDTLVRLVLEDASCQR